MFILVSDVSVIVDTRGVSKGYGFLRFTSEDDQKHCLKTMGGSLGLGCRAIRVGPVSKGHGISTYGFVYKMILKICRNIRLIFELHMQKI